MRWFKVVAVVLFCVGLVLGLYWYSLPGPKDSPLEAGAPVPPPVLSEEDKTYPVPDADALDPAEETTAEDSGAGDSGVAEEAAAPVAEQRGPLPSLGDSDPHVRLELAEMAGEAVLDEWLKHGRIVERLVATINSLDGESISLRFWPVRHLEGLPAIARSGDTMYWSAVNTVRYRVAVDVLTSIEPRAAARVYFRNYPLFQQAWAGQGIKPVYFNDRLVAVVDHLLGAPTVESGFRVTQPKVLYEFADPALESESWGRKILIRMGPENAARVKGWLRRLREELVSGRDGEH